VFALRFGVRGEGTPEYSASALARETPVNYDNSSGIGLAKGGGCDDFWACN